MGVLSTLAQARSFAKRPDGRTRWAFMRDFSIPRADKPDETYLWRLRIIQTPLGGIYLHKILTDDGDRDLHDHPYPFVALILRGGYTEEYTRMATSPAHRGAPGFTTGRWVVRREHVGLRHHGFLSFNVMRSTAAHRITYLHTEGPTWTLMFVGPRMQKWGFWTRRGFVPWDKYVDAENQKLAVS